MKAIVHESYGAPGDVLKLTEIDPPAIGHNDVLVRVRAASINPADWHIIRGQPYVARLAVGLRGPKDQVPGCDVAGRIEAVGSSVSTVQPGDEVFGAPFDSGWGAFAEYASVPADRLAPKPNNLSFQHAAAVPLAAMTALQALRDHGGVKSGSAVLLIGASGGVGSFAVQIARALGAEVTGVCSTNSIELVRSLGADEVIDYTTQDFAEDREKYDLVVHLGGLRPLSDYRRVLKSEGTLLLLGGDSQGRWFGPIGRVVRALALSPFVGHKLANFTVKPNSEDLEFLSRLIEAGAVTPTIDRTWSLAEVAEAITYVEEGHTTGKVVISV